ncbi:MAG TPA: transcriptional regulator [Massilia sp.]|nr:transcriptional regulator [Massilia sp.]
MTRAYHVTHGQTIQRMERLRTLVTELLTRDLPADELADALKLSPSGARKYVADLTAAGVIALAIPVNGTVSVVRRVYTLAVTPEQAQDYLVGLATTAPARAARESKSALSFAAREAGRRFHIMQDDAPFSIRVSRAPVARDWLVAAFFGAGQHEVHA